MEKSRIRKGNMKILKFSAKWCAPCNALKKTLSEMEIPHEVVEVDVDVDMEKVAEYGIRGIPTLVLLDDSGSVVRSKQGITTKKDVLEFLQ